MRRILKIFLFVVLPVVVGVVNILSCGAASGLSTWVAGEEEHPWEKTGTLWALDSIKKQGWIQPEYADSTTNLVPGLTKRGGTAWSPQWFGGYLGVVADGDSITAWNMVPYAASYPVRGVSLLIDLGVIFPLNRITLSTGEGEEPKVNILTGYEIYVNDGDPKNTIAGEPNYTFLARDTENEEAEIDVCFRTQFVRYIKLMIASDYGFLISEIGAYGSGYAPMARYRCDPIDLGSPANFGRIELSAQVDPKAKILLRTRTGSTPDPYIYYGKTGVGGEEAPVSKDQYDALPLLAKGKIEDDTVNWSSWSFPYDVEAALEGTPMVSPGNRRYFQFKIDFLTETFTDKASVDFFSLEYSTPPVAHEIVAELSPVEVTFGQITEFKYLVRSAIRGKETGFDALEIRTPYEAEVEGVKLDSAPIGFSSQVEADRFRLSLDRRVETDELLEISFRCLVTVYGTTFWGKAFDSQTDELPQDIIPGDATPDVDTNSLSVAGTLGGALLESVAVSPNPFTPNGDGTNDFATLSYILLKAKRAVDVEISIYAPQGNLIRTLYSSKDKAGANSVRWDGTDEGGELLPPGVYIYQLSVDTDTDVYTKTGTIALAY